MNTSKCIWIDFVLSVVGIMMRSLAGLHHDPLPASLLERRAVGLPIPKQPEQDLRLQACKEDLGT